MIQDFLRRLAVFLDRPVFPWKKLIVSFTLGQFVLENWLLYRQYNVYKRAVRPKALENEIDQETYKKSQAYSRAKAKFSFASAVFAQAKSLAIIYFDIMPKTWALTGFYIARYLPARFTGEITHSLVWLFAYGFVLDTVLGLPMSYYFNFVLEEKFGFNKMTPRLFFMDMVKTQLLTIAIGTPVGSGLLALMMKTGDSFFYYTWAFTVVVSLVMVTIYPLVIVPIFNKLTPLEPGTLKEGVEALAQRLKFPLDELQVIDGSKRSSHSNAYFTGLQWKKKIVVFDTLIEQSTEKEVEAVLAHELGHWSLSHTTKMLVVSQAHVFFVFALFSAFIRNRSLYQAFGFHKQMPIIIGFFLFNDILAPTDSVVKLLMNIMSRSFEFQADNFAQNLGYKKELATGLIKLQVKNLSSMDADWMYSAYHHSHPILTERLRAMDYVSHEKVGNTKSEDSEKPLRAADREL